MTPKRVIFNFAARCNMNCAFCYIPFTGDRGTLEEQKSYLDRLVDLGAELVTFGGGDPFLEPNFRPLLSYAATLPFRIQIDTNALRLQDSDIALIKRSADFMSLPLEGDADTNALMRGNIKHFDVIMRWLPRLLDAGIPVKINTVATLRNIDHLDRLAAILQPFTARVENPLLRWSIYEFIPAESGSINRQDFELPPGRFDVAMKNLKKQFPDLPIEPGPRSKRKSAYFFTSDKGRVYISNQSAADDNSITVGHIMDNDICKKWAGLLQKTDQGRSFADRSAIRLALTRG